MSSGEPSSAESPRMRTRTLLAEAVKEAWAQKVPSLLTLLVTAATCVVTLMTLGQGAAQQHELATALESSGARVLTVTDTASRDVITPTTMALIRSMTGVESAVALSAPVDVVNTAIPGVEKVPAWQADDPSVIVTPSVGRQDLPGQASGTDEVLAALRMATASGSVRSADSLTRYDVTASGRPGPAYADLAHGLIVTGGPMTAYRQVRIVATDVGRMDELTAAVTDLLGSQDATDLTVETSSALARASTLFSDSATRATHRALLIILGAGAFFSALVTLTDVLLHRRQMGRRRALGITRLDLTTLTALRMGVPAAAGALIGTTGAAAAARPLLHVAVPPDYAIAVGVLAAAAAAAAAVPPAAWASRRDPVAVLRTA